MDIPGVLEGVVDVLGTAGVHAAVDPRDLNAPCAWVAARRFSPLYLCGDGDMTVDVMLIAPDSGTLQAYSTLNDMLTKSLAVLEPEGDISLEEVVTLPTGGGPLPAFRITVLCSGS